MGALNALRTGSSALGRNPILIAAAAIMTLVVFLAQLPRFAFVGSPLLMGVTSLVFSLLLLVLVPFFQGGLIAMADESIDGRTRLGTLVAAGKRHYVSLLVAYLLLLVVGFVLAFVFGIIAIFGGAFVLAGGPQPSGAALGVFGIVFFVVGLLYFLLVFFIQFYGQAIVIDDLGAIDGFRRSVSAVRHHLLSTLGYTVIVTVVSVIVGVLSAAGTFAFSLSSTPMTTPGAGAAIPQVSTGVLAAGVLVGFVIMTIISAFFLVYSVAFYRQIRPGSENTDTNANANANVV